MLDFIEEKGHGLYMYQSDLVILKATMKTVLNRLLNYQCNSLDNYFLHAKKIINKDYLIPIYLHDQLMLIPIYGYKNSQSIYINWANITNYHWNHKTCNLYFKSNRELAIEKSCQYLENQVKRLQLLKESFKKTFSYQLFQSEY